MNSTVISIIILVICAYLLGSIPSAVWIGKHYYGIDVREHGSKNAGTTNTLRVLGKRAAIPVFIIDFLKGFLAVALAILLAYDPEIQPNFIINVKIGLVFAAVLGHIFPIFADFRGGKGYDGRCGSGNLPSGNPALSDSVVLLADDYPLRIVQFDVGRCDVPHLHHDFASY